MTVWDESDIPDLSGRVAVVTGANAGLGLETARMLAAHGARVLMACRNRARAEAAAARVGHGAEVVELDLARLASVEAAAADIAERATRLDILVNNAGLMAVDRGRTEDGFELQFGVNHLGHFALTARLARLLVATPGSRVVNVSSFGHRPGRIHFDDLMFERRYDRWRPYFQSKLANLLFTLELEYRFRRAGLESKALAAHPGAAATDLGHEGSGPANALFRLTGGLGQSTRKGALPQVRAAVDPRARGGEFYGPQFSFAGPPVVERPSRRARDAAAAKRLWEVSEELTGVRFELP
jgi:NAD(P)-dependent dehydrogenase (short-subunit alcohol dehydrogenase family)